MYASFGVERFVVSIMIPPPVFECTPRSNRGDTDRGERVERAATRGTTELDARDRGALLIVVACLSRVTRWRGLTVAVFVAAVIVDDAAAAGGDGTNFPTSDTSCGRRTGSGLSDSLTHDERSSAS